MNLGPTITRRRVLGTIAAAGIYTAGLVSDQALEKLVIDPWLEGREPEGRAFGLAATPLDIEAEIRAGNLSEPQLATLEQWKIDRLAKGVPDVAKARAVRTFKQNGIRWAGRLPAGNELWRRPVKEMPMREQPDPRFGEWRAQSLDRTAERKEPHLYNIVALVRNGYDNIPNMLYWSNLQLPNGDDVTSIPKV